jgi:transposase
MIEFPFDIPEVRVIKSEMNEKGEFIITVESTINSGKCRQCGREIKEFHGHDRVIRLRHLPVFDRRVYVEIQPKRYRCPYCPGNPTTTQKASWYEANSPHTKAYEQSVMRALINSTIGDISRKQGINEEAIEGIIDRQIKPTVDWEIFEVIGILGLDEIALKRGHKNFVVIVTTQWEDGGTAILAVLPDRKKETVKTFLKTIPARLRGTIKRVCTDMYDGYINAVKEELPQANVVVDRFHVAKAYRECADEARKSELRKLKKQLPEAKYDELKGLMWPFRRNAADLDEDVKPKLEKLFLYSPELRMAYQFREELTAIFEKLHSKQEAKTAIQDWRDRVSKSPLTCFKSFLTTLDNWFDEITNYFLDRETSGFVEGLNNKIKVIKRRCYGIFNISHLFQRIYLDLEGYRLFGLL